MARTPKISTAESHGIKKLTDYSHCRLRTEMYYGSRNPHTQTLLQYKDNKWILEDVTFIPAIQTAFREIIDNAMDEIAHGYGNRIDITFNPETFEMSVEDNGRGIPITYDKDHKCHLATLVLSEARAGRNFTVEGRDAESVGTNGIGGAGVNFCSEYYNVEIHRDNKIFKQSFTEAPVGFEDALQIQDPIIKATKSTKTGTKITFKLSNKVFPQMLLPENFIKSRVMELAICNPHIHVYYNGDVVKVKPRPEQNLFYGLKPITIEIKEDVFRSTFYLLPNWLSSGEHIHSIVNNIPAYNGGVHIETFRKLFYGNLLSALERESKRRKLTPNRSDINEGVLIYNITNMKAPNFDSQSKTRLINEEVGIIIKKYLESEDLYKDIIKKNKEWIDEIYQRCADRTQKKDAADVSKLAKKVLRTKVPGLMDANNTDRSKCVLFLAEGLSAISGMAAVRDPDIQGGLALRGKVLNVNGESAKKILDNGALRDIMNALGLVVGERANRHTMRYGKVYIAHDMDPDGLNIGALLINFFHTYWPELFDKDKPPIIHIFMTPFIIAEKGKQRKYWYSHNYDQFKQEEYKGWSITRAKGLGTLIEDDWKYSLQNPVLYSVIDDGKMKDTLDLIFSGKRSDDRKVWIGL